MVLVQNKDGTPLSPCHPARARILLKQKKAKVVSTYPFAIKLTYQVENPKFTPTRAILDDGKTCGIGATQENETHNLALCKAEMKTRGEEISDNLKNRKALRAQGRNHRNKKCGREGKIKIRHRKHKEYPLSIRADVEAKVNAIKRLMKMYPITEIVLEPIKLDVVKTIKKMGMVRLRNERGNALLVVVVVLMCLTVIGMAVASFAAQSARNELQAWQLIQARCIADSGIELAKEELAAEPWRNEVDIKPPDGSEPGIAIEKAEITEISSVSHPDGSITRTVKVNVVGACGNVSKEVEAVFDVTYYP